MAATLMAIAEPPVKTKLEFELPEPGAWEMYRKLVVDLRAGAQLNPAEDLPGRQASASTQ
jgi:hypothetical protein